MPPEDDDWHPARSTADIAEERFAKPPNGTPKAVADEAYRLAWKATKLASAADNRSSELFHSLGRLASEIVSLKTYVEQRLDELMNKLDGVRREAAISQHDHAEEAARGLEMAEKALSKSLPSERVREMIAEGATRLISEKRLLELEALEKARTDARISVRTGILTAVLGGIILLIVGYVFAKMTGTTPH
jgi:hypothetical protein